MRDNKKQSDISSLRSRYTKVGRLTVAETLDREDLTLDELYRDSLWNATAPALCEEGCRIEPDGHCEHGHPSLLLEAGVI